MKKTVSIIGLTAVLCISEVTGQSAESLIRVYGRLSDIEQKYEVMQSIIELDDASSEPFLFEALNDLVYGDLSRFRSDAETYDRWEILTRTIVKELGEIRGESAARTIWDLTRSAEVPLLKSEGFIALGRIGALQYAGEIATMLRNLNFNVRPDTEAAEIEAYGAVTALDELKDDAGFEPLFYASIGWYSDRITDRAADSVRGSFDNAVTQLIGIMERTQDYREKRLALDAALSASAPEAEKTAAVAAALSEGLRYAESDPARRRELAGLRLDALNASIALGVPSEDLPPLIDRAVDEGELDEKLVAIQALGADGGDAAAQYLANRLAGFNERRRNGISLNREELTIVRQLIFAMGESGNRIAADELAEMEYLDYTPALKRQAAEAAAKAGGG